MDLIYLDANATTPLLPEVVEAMTPFWTKHFGNPSSVHQPGQHARSAVEHARESVAALLGCRPGEIVFTSGGTESNNLALFGALHPLSGQPIHLITSSIEHSAVLNTSETLASRGIELTVLPCSSDGIIQPSALEAALRPNTRLVSIMFANNETGVVQPIRELAEIAHRAGALFHTDAVQAAGKLPIDVDALGCDLLTISGHKIYAPKGTGALFIRRKLQLTPLQFGGSHERGRRAGTENVPGIVGLGVAARHACLWLSQDDPTDGPTHLTTLRDRLEAGLLSAIPGSGVNGAGAPRTANTINLFIEGVEAESLVIALDLRGLSVSGGSACQSGATEPSHVLTAMRIPGIRARGSIRLSLSRLTTAAEVDRALEIIPAVARRLREVASGTPALTHA